MAGISAVGAYVPWFRLGPETKDWNQREERAVASFDEDAVSMSAAAAVNCLQGRDRSSIDALYAASTTFPYGEKQVAAVIATCLDLRTDIRTADVTGSLRSGTIALRMALDAVSSGSAKNVLVTAADVRQGPPRSPFERFGGDGGVALLVSAESHQVAVEGSYQVVNEVLDFWRSADETQVRSWEDHFIFEKGYTNAMTQAVEGLLAKSGVAINDFAKVVLYAPDARRHSELVSHIGLNPAQVQAPLFGRLGNTGCAFTLMQLLAALEDARTGQRILLVDYGDGAEALMLRVTGDAGKLQRRRWVSELLASKRSIGEYMDFLRWRGLFSPDTGTRRPAVPPPSPAAVYRGKDELLRFYGLRCEKCKTVHYPHLRVCTICRERDNFTTIRLSDQRAKLFTYTLDHTAGGLDNPQVNATVDFLCGGRAGLLMTDRIPEAVQINMELEMTLRKRGEAGGVHIYRWKCQPPRLAG